MPVKHIPPNANNISSHIEHQIEGDPKDVLRLKGRLVLYANRVQEHFLVRRNSASADVTAERLLLSLVSMLRLNYSSAGVKRAYMQSVRLNKNCLSGQRNSFSHIFGWKLTDLAYDIVEAGRQWLGVMENWMTKKYLTCSWPTPSTSFSTKWRK